MKNALCSLFENNSGKQIYQLHEFTSVVEQLDILMNAWCGFSVFPNDGEKKFEKNKEKVQWDIRLSDVRVAPCTTCQYQSEKEEKKIIEKCLWIAPT